MTNETARVRLAEPMRTVGPLAAHAAAHAPGSLREATELALRLGRLAVNPGSGIGDLWEALATTAAHDLGAARTIEPHLDALAILDQAGRSELGNHGVWGVFAAEGGPAPLVATGNDGSWRLDGVKPWCSLAGMLDSALVTATVPGGRGLFAVSLRQPGVLVEQEAWHARGLAEIPSGPVRFAAMAAEPIGAPGWYLKRPGFAWGGIAVAACWYGGAVGASRALARAAALPDADRLLLMHLGAVDSLLQDCRRALAEAAIMVDDGTAVGTAGNLLAKRVRSTVARSSERVLAHLGHALGPAPLALDATHAKRVADLTLYIRQHHAERDDVSLGEAVLRDGGQPW